MPRPFQTARKVRTTVYIPEDVHLFFKALSYDPVSQTYRQGLSGLITKFLREERARLIQESENANNAG